MSEGRRVAVISPDGQFGTIEEKYADEFRKAGGRVLTKEQAAEKELETEYDKASIGQKIAGAAGMLGPVGHAISAAAGGVLPPTVEAYRQGVAQGGSAGLYQGIARQATEALEGHEAGEAYAKHAKALEEAHPYAHTTGEVAGMAASVLAGGESAAARFIPGGTIGAAGDALGTLVGEGAAGLAQRGAMGRAAAAALKVGAQGATEGALYNVAQTYGDSLLQNTDLTADKVFSAIGTGALWGGLGGAALGAAGSGLRSAVTGTLGRAATEMGGALEQGIGKGAEAAEGLLSKAASKVSDEGVRALAYEQAWRSVGAGQGLQTTRYAGRAKKYLGSTEAVGEVLLRRGVLNPEDGILAAAKDGTPAGLLPKIENALGVVGSEIGDITAASPARLHALDVAGVLDEVSRKYETTAAMRPVGRSIRALGRDLLESMGLVNEESTVSIQQALAERRALDRLVFQDQATLDPKVALEAKREVRTRFEDLITNALDAASDKAPGELRAKYKALKKDYVALSIAQDAAEDSAIRMSKNRLISPSDYMSAAAAAASGHPLGAPVVAIGHKLARERGNAALAVALHKMADAGTVSRLVARTDKWLNGASRGLLTAPPKRPLPEPMPSARPRALAMTAMKAIAALQANPDATMDRISKQTEALAATSPELAHAMTQRMATGLSFLASKMPVHADPDPLDPHAIPHMTDADASTFAKYAWYTERPERFFVDLSHGKLTPEGAETAQALMPSAFAELQERMYDALATHMARGRSVPYQQKLKIGQVLDFAATPSQQPEHARFLQENVAPLNSGTAPAPKPRSAKLPTQRSSLDRLEAGGPGQR